MRWGRVTCFIAGVFALPVCAWAETVTFSVGVAEDESVIHSRVAALQYGYDDANQHLWFDFGSGAPGNGYLAQKNNVTDVNGTDLGTFYVKPGLFVGVHQKTQVVGNTSYTFYMLARFYLKFNLPDLATLYPGYSLKRAWLRGHYAYDYYALDATSSLYYVANDQWNEKAGGPYAAITWNNQPGPTGGPLGSFDPALFTAGTNLPYSWPYWDITSVVSAEYSGGNGILSLVFIQDNEPTDQQSLTTNDRSLEEFSEREWRAAGDNLACAFTICFELELVPEPSPFTALVGLGITGSGIALVRQRTRRRCAISIVAPRLE